jgi:MinD superfamily P-loop ATPase
VVVCFWSPKGGSGTSVVAASAALTLARSTPARLADLTGDQPAVLALDGEPDRGLRNWLLAGPHAPAEALDRIAVEVNPRLTFLPAGAGDVGRALPEAGAALAVALGSDPRPTLVDAGVLASPSVPAIDALIEVADVSIVVVRSCYLTLRRAVRLEATARATGAVLLEEAGRSLAARDIADVLGIPVMATIPVKAAISRSVDAGVLSSRIPDILARPMRELVQRLGETGGERAA